MPTKETRRSQIVWRRTSFQGTTPCSAPVDVGSRILTTHSWTDTRTGVSNPRWREDIRKRRNAGTPLQADREVRRSKYWAVYWSAPFDAVCGVAYKGKLKWRKLEGTYVNQTKVLNTMPIVGDADNAALTEVLGKINEATRDLQGFVFLGELAETLRMIKRPASGLRDGLNRYLDDAKRRVKRLNQRNGRRIPPSPAGVTRASKALADSWLEHVFGWSPLISDIEAGFGSLNLMVERNLFPMKVVTGQSDKPAASQQTVNNLFGDSSPVYGIWERTKVQSVRYRVGVAMEPRTLRAAALDSFGLRAREFVPALWELIPYSFLIDYFTNIGDVVSSFSVQRSRILWINKTTRLTYENSLRGYYANSYYGSSGSTRFLAAPSASWRSVQVTRSQPAYLNTPSVEFEIPGLSSRKWLNIAALVRSGRRTEAAIRRSLT